MDDQIEPRRDSARRFAWDRLFARLERWVRVCGLLKEDDDKIRDASFCIQWLTGLKDGEGPHQEILNAFRECGGLWLDAAPCDVVVLPREIFDKIAAALPTLAPPLAEAGLHLSTDYWAEFGRMHVMAAAETRRHNREREEFERRGVGLPEEASNG